MRSLRVLVVVVLLAVPVLAWAGGFPPKGFEHVLEKSGVTVYQNDDSDYVYVAAQGVIHATPEVVQKTLLKYPKQVGKVPRLAEAKILSKGEGHLKVYQRLSLPVIDDRDFTLKVRWGSKGTSRWVKFNATDDGPPKRDGIVRVKHNTGRWILDPVSGGKATRLRLVNSIDIAGDLPAWAAKSGAGDDIPGLYEAICRLAMQHSGDAPCMK